GPYPLGAARGRGRAVRRVGAGPRGRRPAPGRGVAVRGLLPDPRGAGARVRPRHGDASPGVGAGAVRARRATHRGAVPGGLAQFGRAVVTRRPPGAPGHVALTRNGPPRESRGLYYLLGRPRGRPTGRDTRGRGGRATEGGRRRADRTPRGDRPAVAAVRSRPRRTRPRAGRDAGGARGGPGRHGRDRTHGRDRRHRPPPHHPGYAHAGAVGGRAEPATATR